MRRDNLRAVYPRPFIPVCVLILSCFKWFFKMGKVNYPLFCPRILPVPTIAPSARFEYYQ